jgi:molybdopterin converting factor small subunit
VTVAVRLYAGVRERAGKSRIEVDGRTIAAVRAAVAAACPAIAPQLAFCRFAVDDEFVPDDAVVKPGAVVDVIPPVSGG